MNYRVGQVLYVVLRKEPNVYPMQVVEEITKKTLEGEVTTYMLRAGSDPNKVLSINEIDGEIFDSSDTAKRTLIERVSQSITNRVEQAVNKAKEWYPSGFEHASDDPLTLIKKATLGNGEQAAKPKRQARTETAALAAELAAEAAEADAIVELPDGTKAKVKSVKLPSSLQS